MRKAMTSGILFSVILLHGTTFAAETKEQQKCINALNKGMAKVASTQLKVNGKCASDFAKAKNTNAVTCWSNSAKVTAAQTKTCAAETKSCTTAPDFGKTSCGTVNTNAQQYAREFAEDVFGQAAPNAGITLCDSDKSACKCQASALKGAGKLYSTTLKVYNTCKKKGLKNKTSPIEDAAGLQACASSDPKNKIGKAGTKLDTTITKKCGSVANPFGAGVCAGLNGSALGDCLEKDARCNICFTLNASDNLTINCDLYDDGSSNESCFIIF